MNEFMKNNPWKTFFLACALINLVASVCYLALLKNKIVTPARTEK